MDLHSQRDHLRGSWLAPSCAETRHCLSRYRANNPQLPSIAATENTFAVFSYLVKKCVFAVMPAAIFGYGANKAI